MRQRPPESGICKLPRGQPAAGGYSWNGFRQYFRDRPAGGKPDFRRFDGDMEEWEFHRDNGTPVLTSEPVTIIVQFVNREVVSMDTFKGYGRPAPMHSVVVPPAVNTTVEVFPNHEQVEEARLMTDPEFDEFINKLKITVMNEDQKKLVDRMLRTYDVTSNQCVKIVKEISYTPDQVEMMKKL